MALNYDEISAITEKYFWPKLVDNIFNSNTLFQRARKKWYQKQDGGTKILVPVAYATTTAAGWYSGADTLNVTDNDQVTAAEFDWKQFYANITITRAEELKNSGKQAIINLVKAKVQLAEKTAADDIGTGLYNSGTTTDAIIGLRLAVDSAGTYGGISRTTYSWWSAQEDSSTTAITVATLQSLIGDCTVGNDKPTVIPTTQDQFDNIYGLLQPQQRFADADTVKAGFQNILFNGIPVIVDSHVPSGYLFTLNENYLSFIVHSKEDFRFEPFQKPINQNVSSAKIYWFGALTCSNCRMQGKMTALT